jgi:MOSC domain-containing protein YiiM
VVVEVTQNCTICNHLSSIDKRLHSLLKDDRGIFVKVVEEGFIEKGDKLYLL